MNIQRTVVGAALVGLLTLAGCSGGDEDPQPTAPPVESPNAVQTTPDATEQPEPIEVEEPTDLATRWLVPDDYFAQFPIFEPVHAGASSDNVADITSGTWTFPSEGTAGYVQLISPEPGSLHVVPSQGESATELGFSAFLNSFGETLFQRRIELVYNVAGADPATGAMDTQLQEVTHLYLNTVWGDWQAVVRPIADVPELSTAIADGMTGTAGSYMFRHNGEPIALRVLTENEVGGDLATTGGDEVRLFGVLPQAGDSEGHLLIPAGSAWVNLRFDGDWELDTLDNVPAIATDLTALEGDDAVLYAHDGSAATVTNSDPNVEYFPISVTGEPLTLLTGDQLQIAEGTWWLYARPLSEGD